MSSILTNNGAMVALQTLQSINKNLGTTQSEISTGKSVANAKDNSAVWAISKQMESDVKGFKAIQDSLSLGESTVTVARNAAETVTDLLTDIKGKIVAAQEENVDRDKIQTDITALKDQIASVVGAAQFNGLNLVDGTSNDALNVLSSLDRDSSGSVSASRIEIGRQNLSVTEPATSGVFGGDASSAAVAAAIISADDATTTNDAVASPATGVALADDGTATREITIGRASAGDSYRIEIAGLTVNTADGGSTTAARSFEYVAGSDDSQESVARNLANQISAFFGAATDSSLGYSAEIDATDPTKIVITNGDGVGTPNGDMTIGLTAGEGGTAGSTAASGGLGALSTLDVTTDTGATGALGLIDGLINKSIDAAASFGSAQGRIETQADFVSNLSDSLKSGIGSLVDANMEEASARLQALQVQQQLATQSLSIANQAPQSILSLFR